MTLSRAETLATLGCSWRTLQAWLAEGAPCAERGGLTDTGGPKEWRFSIRDLAYWFRARELAKAGAARKRGKKYFGRRICECCGHLKNYDEMCKEEFYLCLSCDVMLKKHYAEIGLDDEAA